MNALATYLKSVSAHIDSGFNLHDAMIEFVPHFNRMSGEQQHDVRDALVLLVAKKKGIEPKECEKGARKGRPTFERGSAGNSMVNYYMPKAVVENSSTTRKSADPVALLLKKFESMTAAQKRAFLKAVA